MNMLGLDVVEHAFTEGVFRDVDLRIVLQRDRTVAGLDSVRGVYQDLRYRMIFLPAIFTESDGSRVDGEGEKRHCISFNRPAASG
jgi:hypothetical protein